mgnify:CR=1 FL=1|jgi:hypothetical protein
MSTPIRTPLGDIIIQEFIPEYVEDIITRDDSVRCPYYSIRRKELHLQEE